jgi:predicted metal-dependent peptidase
MAVDKHLRLYHSPITEDWTDKEFIGALWHEVNHIMRQHPNRLSHLPKKHNMPGALVNISADMEINDDLQKQGMTLPEGVVYSETYKHFPFQSAEAHFQVFVEEQEKQEQDAPGAGEGEPQQQQQDCGSGSDGGEPRDYELPAPDDGDREREQQRQDEDVVDAAEDHKAQGKIGLPPGMGKDVLDAAIKRLGTTEVDWRSTVAVTVRDAMERKADEAEEYSFRKRSRRAVLDDSLILPGSYRPIPRLGALADVSGSMDEAKLTAVMRELHGILDRLAIPAYTAYAWNTGLKAKVTIQGPSDIRKVLMTRGGGTNMHAGLDYVASKGDEVVVVLTDNETHWREAPPPGVKVIICGINRRGGYPVPKWARLVDVKGEIPDARS